MKLCTTPHVARNIWQRIHSNGLVVDGIALHMSTSKSVRPAGFHMCVTTQSQTKSKQQKTHESKSHMVSAHVWTLMWHFVNTSSQKRILKIHMRSCKHNVCGFYQNAQFMCECVRNVASRNALHIECPLSTSTNSPGNCNPLLPRHTANSTLSIATLFFRDPLALLLKANGL